MDIIKDFSEICEKVESADKEQAVLLLQKFQELHANYKKQLSLSKEWQQALRATIEKTELILIEIRQRHNL